MLPFPFLPKTKAPEIRILCGSQGFSITGDERIELPLRVLETPVIPFDQSPLFLYFYFISFLVDDLSGNTLFIPYQHSFVNRLPFSLLYKRKWLHRHSLFSVPSKLHTLKSFLEIRLPVLEFLFLLLSPLSPALGQALDRLVAVSSIRYRTSTSALSTSSSSRGLTAFAWDISSRGGLHA